jgi:hypothetical protein
MCYVVISKEEIGLPTVISQENKDYPTFLMAGYEEIAKGTKRECEDIAEEILTAFYD